MRNQSDQTPGVAPAPQVERWFTRIMIGLAVVVALWCALFVVALFMPGPNQAKQALAGWFASSATTRATAPTAPPRKEQAETVDPRRLAADPSAYQGKNLVLQGKALNVEQQPSYTWVNLLAQVPGRDSTESIVVMIRPKNTQVLKDECYRMYGVGAGTQETKALLTGATRTTPAVDSYLQEDAPRGQYGSCTPP